MSLKKTANIETPHATYRRGDWEWRVLKTYQTPAKEAANQYARWLVAARSPMTYGSWEYGDTYVHDVVNHAHLVACSAEWAQAYDVRALKGS